MGDRRHRVDQPLAGESGEEQQEGLDASSQPGLTLQQDRRADDDQGYQPHGCCPHGPPDDQTGDRGGEHDVLRVQTDVRGPRSLPDRAGHQVREGWSGQIEEPQGVPEPDLQRIERVMVRVLERSRP